METLIIHKRFNDTIIIQNYYVIIKVIEIKYLDYYNIMKMR